MIESNKIVEKLKLFAILEHFEMKTTTECYAVNEKLIKQDVMKKRGHVTDKALRDRHFTLTSHYLTYVSKETRLKSLTRSKTPVSIPLGMITKVDKTSTGFFVESKTFARIEINCEANKSNEWVDAILNARGTLLFLD